MEHEVYQIYDSIFKRIFTLSNLAIINMINGLFQTNYPPDSAVTYPNKEFISKSMNRRFADVFITINGIHTYHIEAQIQKDDNIVVRVFEYCFFEAMQSREDSEHLIFPQPVVIYLSKESDIPQESTLILEFGEQGSFEYKVKNYLYLEHDVTEINQKKLVVLIPFQLLRLKEIIRKEPTKENFILLQTLIQNDIIGSIEANLKVGNITVDDANQLSELTHRLYTHLYEHYFELGGCEDMKPLLDGAMELPLDKYRIRIDELEAEKARAEEGKARAEQEVRKLQAKIKELESK